MIRVPLTKGVAPSEGATSGRIPIGAGTELMQAQGKAGQVLGALGNNIFEKEQKLQRMDNDRMVIEKKAMIRKKVAELNIDLLNDHEPSKWLSQLQEGMASARSAASLDALPPEARENFDAWYSDYAGAKELAFIRDAKIKTIDQAQNSLQNTVQGYRDDKDFGAAQEAVTDSSYLSPEAKKKWLMNLEKLEMAENIEVEIGTDPFAAREKLDNGGWQHLKGTERLGTGKRIDSAISHARRDIAAEALDFIHSGRITTMEDIVSFGEKLRPTTIAKLGAAMDDLQARQFDGMTIAPVDQMYLIGRIMASLENYTPDGAEGIDDDYVVIASMVRKIDNPDLKKEYKGKLDAMRKGKDLKEVPKEDRNFSDASDNEIVRIREEFSRREVEKVKIIKLTVRDFLKDGFFKDPAKLKSLGYSEDQIEEIKEATEVAEDADMSPFKSWVTPDNEVSYAAQTDKFAELWPERRGEVTADQGVIAFANKLKGGKETLDTFFSETQDEKSRVKVGNQKQALDLKMGELKTAHAEWKADHPEAGDKLAAEHLHELAVSLAADYINAPLEDGFKDEPMHDSARGSLGSGESGAGDIDPAQAKGKTPWASAFVNRIAAQNGLQGSGSLSVRSWLDTGEGVPLERAREGDVAVFRRESSDSWKGHVGIYVGTDGKGGIRVIGGNQDGSVSTKTYPSSRVLGVRRLNRGDQKQRKKIDLPERRGTVEGDWAEGKASTYWDNPKDDNGMTSIGIARKDALWWKNERKPTIALAPETAKALGVSLPEKKGGGYDTSNSEVVVKLPGGREILAVYGENGMYINENSKNKLIDLSEQFQEVSGVNRGDTLEGVKIKKA